MVHSPLWPELRSELKKNPALKAQLKGRNSHASKNSFKKEWANNRAVETKKVLSKITSLTIDDEQEGEMMPLRRLAVELGNDIGAAVNWARSCITLGPPEFEMNVRKVD